MDGRLIREPDTRVVRAWPDQEPAEFTMPQCVYASWLTPELMRETEEG
ncbi:hypothetical protein HEK616_40550 [Streptomyces nigrescens]|uniref:Uncharacterized protein n=1 Tax=Streptomyces nigrescens TaxID=1920 RepID=A0ABM7ZW19_STRNI|nr:hypothetical protein [Streptomyces nigrescens]BDM70568.1 hypothetical protein HEK616_40550 [Streptomyces nigrescens]